MNSLFIFTVIMLGSSLSSPLNNCRCNDAQLSGQELSKTGKQETSINVQEKRHSVKISQEVVPEVEVKIQNSEKLASHQGLDNLASYNNQKQGSKLEEQSKIRNNQKRQPEQNLEYDYYVDENEDLDNDSSNKRNTNHEDDEGAEAYYYDSALPVRKIRLNKEWDEWGAWSPCSASCGSGKSISWRHCKAGGCEPGDKEAKIKICNTNACFF